jgi:hypothetical protein
MERDQGQVMENSIGVSRAKEEVRDREHRAKVPAQD